MKKSEAIEFFGSTTALADALGISSQAVSQWEALGAAVPKLLQGHRGRRKAVHHTGHQFFLKGMAMKHVAKLLLAIIALLSWTFAEAAATAMETLVASMKAGEWRELQTSNLVETVSEVQGIEATGSILIFSEDGVWDPNTRQFFYSGGDRIQTGGTGSQRFIAYSADSNTWQIVSPQPSWIKGNIMHSYDHSAIDPAGGIYYYFTGEDLVRYETATENSTVYELGLGGIIMGVEYFPELGGVVLAAGGNVYLYRQGQGLQQLASGLAMGGDQNFAEYNPVHKVLIFGGGNGKRNLYKLDASGVISPLADAPFDLDSNFSIVTVDPVSGDYLFFGGSAQFYSYNVTSSTWTQRSGADALFANPHDGSAVSMVIASPVSSYGVVMFVKHRPEMGQAWVYLYKHSPGGTTTVLAPASGVAPTLAPSPTPAPAPVPAPVPTFTPPPSDCLSITDFGATGNDTSDDTPAILNTIKAAKAQGKRVYVPVGTFYHHEFTLDGVSLVGAGNTAAILYAPNPSTNTIYVKGSGVTLSKVQVKSLSTSRNPYDWPIFIDKAVNFTIDGILVDGGNAGGIMNFGGTTGKIVNSTVRNTLADAIHNTEGARDIIVANNTVRNPGDDMIAVVSYDDGPPPVTNVLIQDNDVAENSWGRGITVVGGRDVTIQRNKVSRTDYAAGILVATEPFWNTQSVSNVLVRDNTLTDNSSQQTCNSSILVSGLATGKTVDRVRLEGNTITNARCDAIKLEGTNSNTAINSNAMFKPFAQGINLVSGATIYCSGNTLNGAPTTHARCTGTLNFAVTGSSLTYAPSSSPPAPTPPAAPTLTLTANPSIAASGGSTTLSWTSTNATSCTASGDWTGTKTTSGSQVFANLLSNKTYTLGCTGGGGSVTKAATVTVTAPTPAPSPSSPNSLGHWKFDETSGTAAADASGNNRTGTLVNGPIWTSGKIGGALQFDGRNDYVNAGNVLNMGIGSVSFGAWVKTSSGVTEDCVIGKKQDGGLTTGWHLCLDWTNNLVQARISNGTTQVVTNTALSTVAGGTWRHVFVVQDRGAANTQYLYVDGVLRDSDSLSGITGSTDSSTPLRIGTNGGGTGSEFLNGVIDDVRVYSRALSASEVRDLLKRPAGT